MNLIKIHDQLYIPEEFTTRHAYFADEEGTKEYSGVTTVLAVLAKPALIQWAANEVVKYIKENAHLVEKSYLIHPEALELARTAHCRKKEAGGSHGTDVHSLVEVYIKDCIEKNSGSAMQIHDADPKIQGFVRWAVDKQVRFLASEKRVYSRTWWVAGTCDFTCEIAGKRYVGDLKTQAKMWDRTPFYQCGAYMKMLVEMGEANYDGSLIVMANKESGAIQEFYTYAHEEDIVCFESALNLYRSIESFKKSNK